MIAAMADEVRTAMQELTDPTAAGPMFFIAAVPWTRGVEPGQGKIELEHTTQTLADYATFGQMYDHVAQGYKSLLIGQRIGLMRAGEVTSAWPVDNTGWPWTGTPEEDDAWTFLEDPSPAYGRRPASSRGRIWSHGRLADVIEAVTSASAADPGTTFVIARQCSFQAHWH